MAIVAVLLVFIFAFLLGPVVQLNFMTMMPGNIGDARLNNYFLENIYQFFAGCSESLWNLGLYHSLTCLVFQTISLGQLLSVYWLDC